jgi:MoaA/NifB/PqqE/SkfB family radical SAM enzyme
MPFYKGYWMVTNRCNLDCSYCVLEDTPEQLRRELPIADKIALLDHLHLRLGFRRLTLSGGEISLIGRNPPTDFITLLNHARRYRMPGQEGHLEVEIYTNGAFIDERCAEAMVGVVDQVAITFDGNDPQFLRDIGRSRGRFNDYYESAMKAGSLLAKRGIELKIHSVVSRRNLPFLARQLPDILTDLTAHGIRPVKWKFYQYMSYDDTLRDQAHAVSDSDFAAFVNHAEAALGDKGIDLHFKDNKEMHESLFNILSYGNAQYMSDGDSWKTSRRTQDLRNYPDMPTLLSENGIRADLFAKYHTLRT